MVRGIGRTLTVRVVALAEQREVLVKSMPGIVPANEFVVGASAEADGTVLLVLDAEALVDAGARPSVVAAATHTDEITPMPARHRGRILVVDDALTVRELQRTILTRAGYDVIV